MNKLIEGIKTATNYTLTENGALTHISSLSDTLDFFYHAPARRGQDNTSLFLKAFSEDRQTAMRALFYVRDIRGGQGERETFRQGLRLLYKNFKSEFKIALTHVAEYGRWDDILEFVDSEDVQNMVKAQFAKDFDALRSGNSVSLLAKWLPSANTSSNKTKALARKWVRVLGVTEKDYRKALSALRAKIDVIETKMSSKNWKAINYSKVPSKASLRYRTAFHKKDGERYTAFLESAVKGEVKINSAALYPYELVEKYLNPVYGFDDHSTAGLDMTVEAQWKQLPNYADTDVNSLVVCDVSGSMMGGKPSPCSVAISLAIYLAERNKGAFKDHFITFSSSPKLEAIKGNTLYEKVRNLSHADWGMSTNLQSAFNLILSVAMRNKLAQSELPKKLFIVSDMEFNQACGGSTNYEVARAKFQAAGYELPEVVFWNVRSRNNQTPVTKDEQGTFLVSGCSPSIFKNTINCKATTPAELMLEVLNGPRYEKIVVA
jgi:hypothetical protein